MPGMRTMKSQLVLKRVSLWLVVCLWLFPRKAMPWQQQQQQQHKTGGGRARGFFSQHTKAPSVVATRAPRSSTRLASTASPRLPAPPPRWAERALEDYNGALKPPFASHAQVARSGGLATGLTTTTQTTPVGVVSSGQQQQQQQQQQSVSTKKKSPVVVVGDAASSLIDDTSVYAEVRSELVEMGERGRDMLAAYSDRWTRPLRNTSKFAVGLSAAVGCGACGTVAAWAIFSSLAPVGGFVGATAGAFFALTSERSIGRRSRVTRLAVAWSRVCAAAILALCAQLRATARKTSSDLNEKYGAVISDTAKKTGEMISFDLVPAVQQQLQTSFFAASRTVQDWHLEDKFKTGVQAATKLSHDLFGAPPPAGTGAASAASTLVTGGGSSSSASLVGPYASQTPAGGPSSKLGSAPLSAASSSSSSPQQVVVQGSASAYGASQHQQPNFKGGPMMQSGLLAQQQQQQQQLLTQQQQQQRARGVVVGTTGGGAERGMTSGPKNPLLNGGVGRGPRSFPPSSRRRVVSTPPPPTVIELATGRRVSVVPSNGPAAYGGPDDDDDRRPHHPARRRRRDAAYGAIVPEDEYQIIRDDPDFFERGGFSATRLARGVASATIQLARRPFDVVWRAFGGEPRRQGYDRPSSSSAPEVSSGTYYLVAPPQPVATTLLAAATAALVVLVAYEHADDAARLATFCARVAAAAYNGALSEASAGAAALFS